MFGRKHSMFKGPSPSGNGLTVDNPTTFQSSSPNYTKAPPELLPSPNLHSVRRPRDGSTDFDRGATRNHETSHGEPYHHRHSPSLRSVNEHRLPTSSPAKHRSIRRSLTPQPPTRPLLQIPGFGGRRLRSAENVRSATAEPSGSEGFDSADESSSATLIRPPTSRSVTDSQVGAHQGNMSSFSMGPPTSRGTTFQESRSYAPVYAGGGPGAGPSMLMSASGPGGPQNPGAVYQHIHDMASKRISTLDYLRKAHEGRVYWFNTLLFNKIDLAKLPYFDPRRLARRATSYLLLGFSLPAVLDLNTQSPTDYIRAFNSLLADFENYQTAHPPDGSSGSTSLARAKIPQMFKRAAASAGGKGRRSSSVTADMAAFPAAGGDSAGMGGSMSYGATDSAKAAATLGLTPTSGGLPSLPTVGEMGGGAELLPGEEYSHLLTPSLPFDPDYFETFATLCDVLIDCYAKIMTLCTPESCTASVGDMFAKADARVRKIIVAGVVREFEDASRSGVKTEVAGVGKVVLGGLM